MIDIREERWARTTRTWLRKTTALMQANAETATGEQRWLVGYDAGQLLSDVLDSADDLVALLNEDDVEEVERTARALAHRIRARRIAAQLDKVTGRTDAEAATFVQAAARLRAAP